MWQQNFKTWEIRNTAVQKVYTDHGLTRDHEMLIIAAEPERSGPEPEKVQNRAAEIIRTTDFHTMHKKTIKYWIQNFKKTCINYS